MDHDEYREESNKCRDRIRSALKNIEVHHLDINVFHEEMQKALVTAHFWVDMANEHFKVTLESPDTPSEDLL